MQQQMDYTVARDEATKILSFATNMNQMVEETIPQILKKISDNWEGSSANFSQEQWRKNKAEFSEYYEILKTTVANIRNAASEYEKSESAVQNNY